MVKINISIPDELLHEVDEYAAETDRSRSGLLQEAAAKYLDDARRDRARAERVASIERAAQSARSIGSKAKQFDSTAAIRADRDRDGQRGAS